LGANFTDGRAPVITADSAQICHRKSTWLSGCIVALLDSLLLEVDYTSNKNVQAQMPECVAELDPN
jgi:hypothetical protein